MVSGRILFELNAKLLYTKVKTVTNISFNLYVRDGLHPGLVIRIDRTDLTDYALLPLS